MQPILLASSSAYRRDLLKKLGLHFDWASPDIDESPLPNESADMLVERLAIAKANALATQYPAHLIVGSDQVAVLGDDILGKPHNYERAFAQLRAASGQQVIFKTGICLLNTQTNNIQSSVEEFTVNFKILSDEQIHYYLNYEQPYDCAGSFKCEGLGIALFTKLSGDDPNTLIGLPLIRLIEMLNNEGVDPLVLATKKLST
ncbi:MAG: septum formation inhibitor Maf [Gammaproteobacteria bacterium]|nr:MAG: septum formation inhibitor Maf [Gammaproteobacteria bacterium]